MSFSVTEPEVIILLVEVVVMQHTVIIKNRAMRILNVIYFGINTLFTLTDANTEYRHRRKAD